MPEFALAYREPYDFAALLAFFARRTIPGLEEVDAAGYRRRFVLHGVPGALELRMGERGALALRIDCDDARVVAEAEARMRRMFDVDADIEAVNAQLGRRRLLKRLVTAHPGQRVPGGWDGFEIAVRAVLGQQVSVAAARTLAVRLVQRFGVSAGGNAHVFPSPEVLADADLASLGITRARAASLRAIAQAVCAGSLHFDPDQALDAFVASCVALPGIGPWTAHYIAMRGLHNPDAFPAADLVLRKAVSRDGIPIATRELDEIARAWRPYRAYAVLHLWRSQA